ncbi:MAG TPA: hypothetical protein VK168_11500 [Saprospiraceae bacterium]|nr:hypothetical protein [Saprospiraceae bacterium]
MQRKIQRSQKFKIFGAAKVTVLIPDVHWKSVVLFLPRPAFAVLWRLEDTGRAQMSNNADLDNMTFHDFTWVEYQN